MHKVVSFNLEEFTRQLAKAAQRAAEVGKAVPKKALTDAKKVNRDDALTAITQGIQDAAEAASGSLHEQVTQIVLALPPYLPPAPVQKSLSVTDLKHVDILPLDLNLDSTRSPKHVVSTEADTAAGSEAKVAATPKITVPISASAAAATDDETVLQDMATRRFLHLEFHKAKSVFLQQLSWVDTFAHLQARLNQNWEHMCVTAKTGILPVVGPLHLVSEQAMHIAYVKNENHSQINLYNAVTQETRLVTCAAPIHEIKISGEHLFVLHDKGIDIYPLENIASPAKKIPVENAHNLAIHGSRFVVSTDKGIQLYSLTEEPPLIRGFKMAKVTALALSESQIAVGHDDGTLTLINPQQEDNLMVPIFKAHTGPITNVKFNSQDLYSVSGLTATKWTDTQSYTSPCRGQKALEFTHSVPISELMIIPLLNQQAVVATLGNNLALRPTTTRDRNGEITLNTTEKVAGVDKRLNVHSDIYGFTVYDLNTGINTRFDFSGPYTGDQRMSTAGNVLSKSASAAASYLRNLVSTPTST